jgi:hypothetical protein
MGLIIYDAVKQHIFILFSNAMLMQKSKHAKRRMIKQLLESNYVKRETDAMLEKDKYE